MSDYIQVIAIVEGKTEQIFVKSVLAPYLAKKGVYISPTQITKPGQKGGDVKYSRVKRDIKIHLKQRMDTYVTTFVDYYGIKEWPGINNVPAGSTPLEISEHINQATTDKVNKSFSNQQSDRRFIPFIAMHEFEALLFSDSELLADAMEVDEGEIINVLEECGEPEAVNNSRHTAPSKRLDGWSKNRKFAKTTQGIAIARDIGVKKMRDECPVFDEWLNKLEGLVEDVD